MILIRFDIMIIYTIFKLDLKFPFATLKKKRINLNLLLSFLMDWLTENSSVQTTKPCRKC